jgi:Flp pilus assembly protein TadD
LWLGLLLALAAGVAVMTAAAADRHRLETLNARLRVAQRAEAAARLHALAERLRYLAGADSGAAGTDSLRQECRAAWESRALLTDASAAPLGAAAEERLREDLLDLALLGPDVEGAASADEIRAHLGRDAPAPQEHLARGRALLRSGELARAAEELGRATQLRPQDFWAHFYSGVCAYRRGEPAEAVHSFDVALALAPGSPECYANRGLAYAADGKKERARSDYDRALVIDPGTATARLNRGVLFYQEGRLEQAAADLELALRDGADPATAHYDLTLVRLAAHDEAAARRELGAALAADPGHAEAKALRERLAEKTATPAGLPGR